MGEGLKKFGVLMCCFVLTALFGCTPEVTDDEAHLKTVVARYNDALVSAYKNQFFDSLSEVSVEAEAGKVHALVNSYLQGNQVMDSELHSMDFKEMKVADNKATVRTSEKWSYRWINFRTGEEVEPMRDIHYEMLYHFVKEEGKWLVEMVEDLGEGGG